MATFSIATALGIALSMATASPGLATDGPESGVSVYAPGTTLVAGLSLAITSDTPASFAAPSANADRSVTSGLLTGIHVTDARSDSPGWWLQVDVTNFQQQVNPLASFSNASLGISPRCDAGSDCSTISFASTTAGVARYPYVMAATGAGPSTGAVDLSADLSLVTPPRTPAGSYGATLTLTLLSN